MDLLLDPPLAAAGDSELHDEFARLPRLQRWRLRAKLAQRQALLRWNGQAALEVVRFPDHIRSLLWVYHWSTVGDAVMDLSARALIPAHVEVDLLIPPSLAGLWSREPRFRRVHTDWPVGQSTCDAVLLQSLSTSVIRQKAQWAPQTPWASVLGHLHGEHFARTGVGQARMAQLWRLSPAPAQVPPTLARPVNRAMVHAVAAAATTHGPRIAIALGARDPRRRYPHWADVLRGVVEHWPVGRGLPHFLLVGQHDALDDVAALRPEWLRAHCSVWVDRLSLAETADLLAACDAFCGADGGLMHLALAHGLPGVALFTQIQPRLRLSPGATLTPLFDAEDIARIPPAQVVAHLLDEVQASHRCDVT